MQKITLISLQHATCLAPDKFRSQLRPWQRVGTGIKHWYVQCIGTICLKNLISPFYQCWHDSLKVVYFKNSCVKLMAEELCAQHLFLLTQITKHLFWGPYWGWMINNWTCNGTEICNLKATFTSYARNMTQMWKQTNTCSPVSLLRYFSYLEVQKKSYPVLPFDTV